MRPSTLYRGIVLTQQQFYNLNWYDKDIEVHYEPLLDSQGRKVVLDNNEYGVYMTDNLAMVQYAYGNPRGKCTSFEHSPEFAVSQLKKKVGTPQIGITYEINTNGLDIREPFMNEMKGHYNNGFSGKEWIADIIPKENYKVLSIKIGSDILHGEKEFNCYDFNSTVNHVADELQKREARLSHFCQQLEHLSNRERMWMQRNDMNDYQNIFGEYGLLYLDLDQMNIQTADDVFTYMQASICQNSFKNGEKIDLQDLRILNELKNRANEHYTSRAAENIISQEAEAILQKRQLLISEGRSVDRLDSLVGKLDRWAEMAYQIARMEKMYSLESINIGDKTQDFNDEIALSR